jgi:hypothetical protein
VGERQVRIGMRKVMKLGVIELGWQGRGVR